MGISKRQGMKLLLLAAVVALGCQANAAHEAEQSVASLNAEEGVNHLIKGEHAHAEQDTDSDDVKDDVQESTLPSHGYNWNEFPDRYRKIFVAKDCIPKEEDLGQGADHNAEEQLTDENAEEEQQSASRRILGRPPPPPPPVHGRNYLGSIKETTYEKQRGGATVLTVLETRVDTVENCGTSCPNPASLWWFTDCMFTDENASPQVYAPWYQEEQLADENAETEQQSASRRILGRRDKPIQESIQCRVRRTQHDHPTTKHPPNLSIGRRRISVRLREDQKNDVVEPDNSWRMWRTKGECKLLNHVNYCPFHLASVKHKFQFLTANSQGEGQVSLGDDNAPEQCLNSWYISTKMWYSATYAARQAYCAKSGRETCGDTCAAGTNPNPNPASTDTGCGNCLSLNTADDGSRECACWCCERLQAFEAGSTGNNAWDKKCAVT